MRGLIMSRLRHLLPLTTLTACLALPQAQLKPVPAPEAAQAEAFYAASSPASLKDQADKALQLNPSSAQAHELAAQENLLEGEDDTAFVHLLSALSDLNDDAALLHVHQLGAEAWTQAHRKPALSLLLALGERHPDADVRAASAYYAAHQLSLLGELEQRDRLISALPGRVPLSLVGTWDNEQGKGFEEELAPESRPALNETYPGRAHPLAWRRDAPLDPRGRYDLTALLAPNRWVVAYAQGRFTAPEGGTWALRLTTSDPVKVWVDGRLVFSASQLDESVFENLVVPVRVTKGEHVVLLKTAQREGTWLLSLRAVPAGPDEFKKPLADVDALLDWRVRNAKSPDRRAAQRLSWARLSVGGLWAVHSADAWVKQSPKSLLARLGLIDALWFNQERGRTADLLNALDLEVGEQVPFLRLRAIRFQQQQGLKLKARERLLKLLEAHPKLREARGLLADTYQQEGWLEDELEQERANLEDFSPTATERFEHARTLLRDGRIAEARALLHELTDALPGHLESVRKLAELALDASELGEAERHTLWRLKVWPTDLSGWTTLAEIYRRQGSRPSADEALRQAQYLCPDWATAAASRAALAYQGGDKETAVSLWRNALSLNPEDERLQARLDFLAPEAKAPWADDVPDESQLEKAVALRSQVKPLTGADVAYLLDHEAMQLASDGSTQSVVTLVMHAFNAAGRDRLTKQSVPTSGRLRMLHAYAIDPNGGRTEAQSERQGQVFFRNLQAGSTVVLQYRVDEAAKGYLARHLTRTWSFQGLSDQRVKAEYVLWAPLSTKLHESTVGQVKREESKRGEQLRIAWSLAEAPPLVFEPAMPTVQELSANIRISTVPDWDTWLSWEKALLTGAFRTSPELDAVAERLSAAAKEPKEKALKLHEFVMEEIRYQQDYESFIAGVKPHAAPMVLERKYGDCKDKAVLFITLAKKLGLKAQFALVRTRDAGPVEPDVPMQQFNHAVVYLPPQPGFEAGRFFDPTADALDLEALRSDDSGTQSLVFDPDSGEHTWVEMPYDAASLNSERWRVSLELDAQGGATGSLSVASVGRTGSLLRRTARNLELTSQLLQRQAQRLVNGGSAFEPKVDEVKDLRQPAQLSTSVSTRTLGRVEGGDLRLKLPSDFSVKGGFALASRRHPLVLGVPSQSVTEVELSVPEGFSVSRAPLDAEVKAPCLTFSRKVRVQALKVTALFEGKVLCERISAKEYGEYRKHADDISRLLDEELVLSATKGPKAPKAPKAP